MIKVSICISYKYEIIDGYFFFSIEFLIWIKVFYNGYLYIEEIIIVGYCMI